MTIQDVRNEAGRITGTEVLVYARELMAENEIDHHESDLYLKVNEASTAIRDNYENNWMVTTFVDNIDHERWYEFPFCYWTDGKKS